MEAVNAFNQEVGAGERATKRGPRRGGGGVTRRPPSRPPAPRASGRARAHRLRPARGAAARARRRAGSATAGENGGERGRAVQRPLREAPRGPGRAGPARREALEGAPGLPGSLRPPAAAFLSLRAAPQSGVPGSQAGSRGARAVTRRSRSRGSRGSGPAFPGSGLAGEPRCEAAGRAEPAGAGSHGGDSSLGWDSGIDPSSGDWAGWKAFTRLCYGTKVPPCLLLVLGCFFFLFLSQLEAERAVVVFCIISSNSIQPLLC